MKLTILKNSIAGVFIGIFVALHAFLSFLSASGQLVAYSGLMWGMFAMTILVSVLFSGLAIAKEENEAISSVLIAIQVLSFFVYVISGISVGIAESGNLTTAFIFQSGTGLISVLTAYGFWVNSITSEEN